LAPWCTAALSLALQANCSSSPVASGAEGGRALLEGNGGTPALPADSNLLEGSAGTDTSPSTDAPPVTASEANSPAVLPPSGAGGTASGDGESAAGQAGMAEPSAATDEPPPSSDDPPPSDDPPSNGDPPSSGPVTLFLAGDSIVQTYADTTSDRDQAGWGQMLGEFASADVRVDNRAIGGRTARRFIDEGRLDDLAADLLAGDYLLVQFGTNDGNRTATYQLGDEVVPYFLDPATAFKTWLGRYVDAARARGAIPVFVTPPPRNSAYCTGGNGTGAHAQAMRELGQALGVGVVDLNADSVAYLRAICPAPTPENFFFLGADGSVDGTHFQENGARTLARFVARGLAVAAPDLAGALSE
jgi:lysophospholipase L1-like esterase